VELNDGQVRRDEVIAKGLSYSPLNNHLSNEPLSPYKDYCKPRYQGIHRRQLVCAGGDHEGPST